MQTEAEQMRDALKTIACYYNAALPTNGAQSAALHTRQTLEDLGLLFQTDLSENADSAEKSSES